MCPGGWERFSAQRPGARPGDPFTVGKGRRDADGRHPTLRDTALVRVALLLTGKASFLLCPISASKGTKDFQTWDCLHPDKWGGGCRWWISLPVAMRGCFRTLLQCPSPPSTPSRHLSLDFRYLATSSFSPKGFGNKGGIVPGHLGALKPPEPTAASRPFLGLLQTARSLFPPTGPKAWDQVGTEGTEVVLAFGPSPLTAHPSVQLSRLSDWPVCRGIFLTSRASAGDSRSPRLRTHKPAHPTPDQKQPSTASTHTRWPWWAPRLWFPCPGRCHIPDVGDTVLTHVRPRGSGNWWTQCAPPLVSTHNYCKWIFALELARRNTPGKRSHTKVTVTSHAERLGGVMVKCIDLTQNELNLNLGSAI